MATTIAGYYLDELANWNESILFYNSEIEELEKKLLEVINRNSIVGIAERVEVQQNLINAITDKFYRLQIEFQDQENALKQDSSIIDNEQINAEAENRQSALRTKMQETEMKYVDVKFDCYKFLSSVLKK